MWVASLVGLATIGLSGCAELGLDAGQTDEPLPSISATPAPSLDIAKLNVVDPSAFDDGYGDYIFRVGSSPVWCTISPTFGFTICELNEADAQYQALPTPDTCNFSYGYQMRLWGAKPEIGELAEFVCTSGAFADPSKAPELLQGQLLSVPPYACYLIDDAARCETEAGSYIYLGVKGWALQP